MEAKMARKVYRITITQVNWDGKGNDRQFVRYAEEGTLDQVLRQIHAAYRMESTRVTVQ